MLIIRMKDDFSQIWNTLAIEGTRSVQLIYNPNPDTRWERICNAENH